jgi:hypothetical protein
LGINPEREYALQGDLKVTGGGRVLSQCYGTDRLPYFSDNLKAAAAARPFAKGLFLNGDQFYARGNVP